MMPVRIDLDFQSRQKKLPMLGLAVLTMGLVAAYWTFSDLQHSRVQAELIEMSLSRYQQTRSSPDDQADREETARIKAAVRPLGTPWSALLNDLERATEESGKDIALLEVTPDRMKRQVRISAEARSLPAALDYVEQLQSSATLLYPMLEKHEVRTADRERPVRFDVAAEWRLAE